jgi:hypothetical protein
VLTGVNPTLVPRETPSSKKKAAQEPHERSA